MFDKEILSVKKKAEDFSSSLKGADSVGSLIQLALKGLSALKLPPFCVSLLSQDKKTGTLFQGRKFHEEPMPDPISTGETLNFNYGKSPFQVEDPESSQVYPLMKALYFEGKTIISENIPFEEGSDDQLEVWPLVESTRAFLNGTKWENYSGILKFPGMMQLLPFKSSIISPFSSKTGIAGAIELNGTRKISLQADHITLARQLACTLSDHLSDL